MPFQVRRVSETRKKNRFRAIASLLISVLRPLAALYASRKREREKEERMGKRMLLLKRGLLILLAVLCALFLVAGTVKALVGLRILTMRSFLSLTGADLPRDEHGFTNILLIGQGDAGHDGQDLTDTVIVASLDPTETKSAVLLSLPRDLYFLKTEKMGKGRLNSLYRDYKILLRRQGMKEQEASLESMKELAKTIGDAFELPIHRVIKADFTGFVKAVDAIGGVDITVLEAINDVEYPDENYGFEPFSLAAGPAHLDGATALKYARSRHGASDYGRSARQQQLIVAIGEKIKNKGLYKDASTITDLLKIFSDHVQMTLTVRELIGLADLAETLSPSRVITMQLNDRNALYEEVIEPGGFLYAPPRSEFEGASVLLPVSIPEFPVTWKQIRTLSHLLFEQRSAYLAHPTFAVLNAGAKSGLGRKLGTELTRYGWKVERIANTSLAKRKDSFVAAETEAEKPLAEFFADLLKLPLQELPAALPADEVRPITIVLGKDFSYEPIQDLLTVSR